MCVAEGETIRAGIPFADVHSFMTGNRWVSLPFSDHCEPLLPEDDRCALEMLVAFLKRRQQLGAPRMEIRWEIESSQQTFREVNFIHQWIPLQRDPEAVFKKFKKSTVWRHLHCAERHGITVKECTTLDEFMNFYRLQVMTRRRHGVPVQPKRFFAAVWERLLQHGCGFCLLAYKDDQPIAGGVFLTHGRTAVYKYSASDVRFRALNPGYPIMWEAIQRVCRQGCTMLDLGRSAKGDAGLRRHKKAWGALERELPYTIITSNPPKHGPEILDSVLASIIRHSPRFVCSVTGQLLYKHFA